MSLQPLEFEFSVSGFDCGYGGSYRPLALANILQEAAARNADQLGFGSGAMTERGLTWMLSRMDLCVDRPLLEGKRYLVRTWPSGFEKMFAVRDFQIIDAEAGGLSMVRASWAYLVIDLAARRPLRAANNFGTELICDAGRILPDAVFAVPATASDDWQESFEQTAMERHIDHNGHVNSAHLIAWLCDAPPLELRGVATAGAVGGAAAAATAGPGSTAASRDSTAPDAYQRADSGTAITKAGPASGPQVGQLARLRVEFAQEALRGDRLTAEWSSLPPQDQPPSAVHPTAAQGQLCRLRRGTDICARAELYWL